jgi:predicted AAA+ superfamily ATPase
MIKREIYLKKIRPFYQSELIKVITGIRRSGKSVILRQIMEEIRMDSNTDDNIVYINFEDFEYADIKSAKDLHIFVKEKVRGEQKFYLFFDEIQNVEDFEKAINSFRATMNVSIFITGSNARLLSGELSTLLSGRYVSFRVYPFCFKEYCQVRELEDTVERDKMFLEFAEWGGMPQRFQINNLDDTRVFLHDLYNSIVLKDIVQRSGAKDVDLLNKIIEYIVINPSQTFSAGAISKFFEKDNRKLSTETLYNYLRYICDSFIVSKASRYDIRGKKMLSTLDKYYLTDAGIGRIRNSGFKMEIGAMLENVVYNELLVRGYEVYVGKTTKGEIDFIAVRNEVKEYYQVAYLLADESVIAREFGAFNFVPDNFPKYVLSMDLVDFSREGIVHKNIVNFLLEP